jgi:hypothetical protein
VGVVFWFLAAMCGLISAIGGSTLAKILADEFKSCNPSLVAAMLNRAIARLPIHLRARYRDEWSDRLMKTPGDVGKLLAGIRFGIASHGMAADSPDEQLLLFFSGHGLNPTVLVDGGIFANRVLIIDACRPAA